MGILKNLIIQNDKSLNFLLSNGFDISENVSNIIVKKHDCYILYKELNTHTYIMSFTNDFILLHFNKNCYSLKDFEYMYSNTNLLFKIFETEFHYHVFCISQYNIKNKQETLNFMTQTDCNYKFTSLQNIYNSFIIINKNINNSNDDKYSFVKYVGSPESRNNEIERQIDTCIKIANEYIKFLPYNYLNLNFG